MFKDLTPYPEEVIGDANAPALDPNQYYTMCLALRELYLQLPDRDVRKKLRYIATLAKVVTDRLNQLDPVFFFAMYPRVREYETFMADKEAQ